MTVLSICSSQFQRKKRKAYAKCSNIEAWNLNFPIEIIASILEFAISDLETYQSCCLVSKCWYFGVLLSPDSSKIWQGLVRRHYPIAEQLATSLRTQLHMKNFPIVWKYEYMKQHFYTRSDTMYTNITPDLLPPPISSYIFQIDIDCHTARPTKNDQNRSRDNLMTTSTIRISSIVDGGKGALWDHDNLSIDLKDSMTDQLRTLDIRRFDINIHVIDKRSGLRALLFKGEPEDWVDNNLYFYGNFSPPRRLFAEFGICAFVYANRCECTCPAHEESCFFQPRSPPLFEPNCECGQCSEAAQRCSCCSCKEPWSCFHSYSIVIHPFSHYEDDLGTMPYMEFLRFLDRGFSYL